MSTEVADALVERLMEKVKDNSAEVAAMLGDPDIGSAFHGGIKDISNNKSKHPIYDTETGERRDIPLMYLKKTLQKKRRITLPDGTQKVIDAFVPGDEATGAPVYRVPEYTRGNLKCFLHPEHPERDWLASVGVGPEVVCGDNETAPAGSFKTTYTRDYHEKKKHPITWQVRDEARKAQKEQEAIDRQERQIEAMMSMANRGAAAPLPPLADEPAIYRCRETGCARFFDSEQGRTLHEGKHKE